MLVDLAETIFPSLSDAEKTVLRRAEEGDAAEFDVEDKPSIDGKLIRWLCSDERARALISPRGLILRGASIEDDLILTGVQAGIRLGLICCELRQLQLSDARFGTICVDGASCAGVMADRLHVEGSLMMRRFEVTAPAGEKAISLLRATVTGDLDCTGAKFLAPGRLAIDLQRAAIGGSVGLRAEREGEIEAFGFEDDEAREFHASGAIHLLQAQIGGTLLCSGASLQDGSSQADDEHDTPEPWALDATGVSAGAVYLNRGFHAADDVRFDGAVVAGTLNCDGARFDACFSAWRAKVGLSFRWTSVELGHGGEVKLTSMDAGGVDFDLAGWPREGGLDLTGMTYRSLTTERDLLDVIRRQTRTDGPPGYATQPYEQLARVLAENGETRAAEAVHIARIDDRERTRGWPRRAAAWVVKWGVGYGYRPLRVGWPVLFFIVLGTILFSIAHGHGHIVAGDKVHPPFSAWAYSLDVLLPVIDFGQDGSWTIATHDVSPLAVYYWFHVAMGWLLSSFLVVALTRSTR